MIPLVEPAVQMYTPLLFGIVWSAALAVAGMFAVVGLIVLGNRRRPRATVTPLHSRLPEAA